MTGPLTLAIEVRSSTTDKTFTLQAIVVELAEPFALKGRFDKKDFVTPDQPVRDLKPGSSLFRSVTVQRRGFWRDPRGCVTYRCGNNRLVIRINYYEGMPQKSGEIVEFVELRPRSALMAVIAGGIVGVVLATIFSGVRQIMRGQTQQAQSTTSSPWWRSAARAALSVFGTILYGAVATATGILLLSATTVPDFPISVSVCDSLGGLVLGLFFKPVGEFVQSKITS